ncbi:MAG: hypothetical protein MI974_14165 [Chitinophagales bacterium]|nr:hypothetical protein [Chitinophagales bacterium]
MNQINTFTSNINSFTMKCLNFLLINCCLILSSCAISRYTAPPFTNVEKILQLKPEMTIDEVSDILKIPPYDIVHSYESGSMVLSYNYRVKDRNMVVPTRSAQQVIHSEDAQREGEDWYNTNYHSVFLHFQDDALKSIFSETLINKGIYIEILDKKLISPDSNFIMDGNYHLLLENGYENYSYTQEAQLKEDEQIKRRRNTLKQVGVGALIILGLIF